MVGQQWKSRQIASGEARENANFLPLGGDWYVYLTSCILSRERVRCLFCWVEPEIFLVVDRRERVKRKRAEANAQPSLPGNEAGRDKKKPDLSQLSKGLPTGWKVHVF